MEYRILSGVALSNDESELEDIAKVGSYKGHWMGEFDLTNKVFKQIIANAKKSPIKIVIDYDHKSFWGSDSRAAGWVGPKDLSISADGSTLLMKPEWTEAGRKAIKEREYKYKSPVISLSHTDPTTGERVESAILHSVALTNTPFLTELSEVRINSLNQSFKGEGNMEDLKKIAAVLGVEASVDAIVNSCQQLQTRVKEFEPKAKLGETALLELGCTAEALVATCMELKNPARGQDQVVALQARIAELEGLNRSREASDAVARALTAGKLTAPGTELHTWALSFAQKDINGFETWVNAAPQMVPTEPVTPIESHLRDLPQVVLSKSLGLTEEDLKEYGNKI